MTGKREREEEREEALMNEKTRRKSSTYYYIQRRVVVLRCDHSLTSLPTHTLGLHAPGTALPLPVHRIIITLILISAQFFCTQRYDKVIVCVDPLSVVSTKEAVPAPSKGRSCPTPSHGRAYHQAREGRAPHPARRGRAPQPAKEGRARIRHKSRDG